MSSSRGRSWSRFGNDHGKVWEGNDSFLYQKVTLCHLDFTLTRRTVHWSSLNCLKKSLLVALTKPSEGRLFQFYIQEEGVGNQSFKHKKKQTKTIDLETHQGICTVKPPRMGNPANINQGRGKCQRRPVCSS